MAASAKWSAAAARARQGSLRTGKVMSDTTTRSAPSSWTDRAR